jgi:CheY-like chemotaxis protein
MMERPAHILVVDDEEAIRVTLDMLLRRRGYAVTTAANGEEALTLLEQRSFDLLLLDLMMPGMTGLDVAAHARDVQPTAAVLILTGSSSIEGVPEDPRLDHVPHMLKTASPQEVLERVAAVLHRPERAA